MILICPKCGSELDAQDSLIEGQHVLCAACKSKSTFTHGTLLRIRWNPISAYYNAIKIFTDYTGVAARSEYWYFVLSAFIVDRLFWCLDNFFGLAGWMLLVYEIFILFPYFSISVRRMHDIGKSGFWVLIGFIPFVGLIWWIVFACLPSKVRNNAYLM